MTKMSLYQPHCGYFIVLYDVIFIFECPKLYNFEISYIFIDKMS